MTFKVAITDRAFEELDGACQWWSANRSGEQALGWYNGFIEAIRTLADDPERHPLAPENAAFPYHVRQLLYGVSGRATHRAVFTVRPNLVLILRVRHLAQKEISIDD